MRACMYSRTAPSPHAPSPHHARVMTSTVAARVGGLRRCRWRAGTVQPSASSGHDKPLMAAKAWDGVPALPRCPERVKFHNACLGKGTVGIYFSSQQLGLRRRPKDTEVREQRRSTASFPPLQMARVSELHAFDCAAGGFSFRRRCSASAGTVRARQKKQPAAARQPRSGRRVGQDTRSDEQVSDRESNCNFEARREAGGGRRAEGDARCAKAKSLWERTPQGRPREGSRV